MILDQKALRLYALVMLPVVLAATWFVFWYEKRLSSVPIAPGSIAVTIGGRTFSAEVADTIASRKLGLGERDSLCADCAMLFRFGQPGKYGFWMKGMRFPIDIAWIHDERIVHIERNVSPYHVGTMYPNAEVAEVLETNAGALSGVSIGDEAVIGSGQ
ncbi:MAG: DUF192 domain-containing protein [Candidatus Moranbacteria bacterium]|nr:DUF192 domain-containing protein [Candidatus Moranbacteria bacterium]